MMKTKNLLVTLLLACTCVACSNDKNEDTPLNQSVIGKYEGYVKAVAQYFPSGQYANTQSLTLSSNEDETVKVTYISDSFGTFTINNATVELKDNSYILKGDGVTAMSMGTSAKEYACTFEGTINKDKSAPTFEFKVPAVMGGLTLTMNTGDTPAKLILPGTYEGYTKAVAQYFPNGQYAADQTVTVTANEDETFKVTYTSNSFGTFTISNATVKMEKGNYIIEGTGTTLMGMTGKEPTEYQCTLAGSIDVAKDVPSFVFTIPAVMGGMSITFAEGDVPETTNK